MQVRVEKPGNLTKQTHGLISQRKKLATEYYDLNVKKKNIYGLNLIGKIKKLKKISPHGMRQKKGE